MQMFFLNFHICLRRDIHVCLCVGPFFGERVLPCCCFWLRSQYVAKMDLEVTVILLSQPSVAALQSRDITFSSNSPGNIKIVIKEDESN